jgi:dihydrofolate reductase
MEICLVAALADNRVIGRDNRLPWHLPADLRHFRALTLGKPVIMGRRTHLSLDRPLPDRHNIVLTRQVDFCAVGCTVVHSTTEALAVAAPAPVVMVIGGAAVYAEFFPLAQRLYLTWVHGNFPGDAYFPAWDEEAWRETARQDCPADATHDIPYSFVILERVATQPVAPSASRV